MAAGEWTRSSDLARGVMVWAGVAGWALLGSAALAGPVPDYGFNWVTVGDPGNRATLPEEVPSMPNLRIGAVDHTFRLTRTKINNLQMLEFVRAYAPFWQGDPRDPMLTSDWIWPVRQPDGSYDYEIEEGAEHWAAYMGWEMAARYCNWLHNGKLHEAWAFESGAYDTSTFTENDDGSFNHQRAHSEGALFWIPTLDELIKGAYWDPNKNGVGGYHMHPGGSDEQLIEGLPEDGGQTIGALIWDLGSEWGGWDLEQYPNTRSPWGLLDISATEKDWTETPEMIDPSRNAGREVVGSVAGDLTWFVFDRLDLRGAHSIWSSVGGALRIASILPPECDADRTGDGSLDVSDVQVFLADFAAHNAPADWIDDGRFDFFDVQAYLSDFAAGCP